METPVRYLHKHPLKLLLLLPMVGEDGGEAAPDRCKKRTCHHCNEDELLLSGRVYACSDGCEFYLHEACANLPERIHHPFHPSCPLFLKLVPLADSHEDGTENQEMMISYRCEACSFEMDGASALYQPGSFKEEEEELPRGCPVKGHPLKLKSYDEEANAEVRCYGCKELISGGKCYFCKSCGYYLHEGCAFLPSKIRHFFHPCRLSLVDFNKFECDACLQKCSDTYGYYCKKCNFAMHVECTKFSPIGADEEGILHVSHHHPLKLTREETQGMFDCKICKKPVSGKCYACLSCGYYLHEDCAFLPSEIQHFFHPCRLSLVKFTKFKCEACLQKGSNTSGYYCEKCNFAMHVECTKFSPIGSDEEGILHFSHHHPLKLTVEETHGTSDCRICKKTISGKSYACLSCGYYIHLSCGNLPRQIQHFFHGCPLSLRILDNKHRCDACQQDCSAILGYHCEKCDFDMHVECTQFSPIGSDEEGILHFSHRHPLKLTREEEDETPDCRGCRKPISGESYACLSCRYYLHLSCANLPREIQHFFHGCPLSLKILRRTQCDACFSQCDGVFGYHCGKCNFDMHVACTQLLPLGSDEDKGDRIEDLSHHHPLKLYEEGERGDDSIECNLCDTRITDQEAYGACELCQYHIHKSCMGLHKTWVSTRFNPITTEDGRKRIQDWSHVDHFLHLFEAGGNSYYRCYLCDREITSETESAACKDCEFYVHKSCLGSPPKIQLPCHPCPLSLGPRKHFDCNVCNAHKEAIPYQCEECSFYMDVDCAQLSQEVEEGDQGEPIHHLSHHHPLKLFKDPKRDKTDELLGRKLECLVCAGTASGLTYGCKWCGFYLHKSCLEVLPQSIAIGDCSFVLSRFQRSCRKCGNHISDWGFYPDTVIASPWCIPCALREALSFRVSPSSISTQLHFHPCNLTLKLFPTFTCNACFTQCHSHAYYCNLCDFYVGIKCAQISRKSCKGGGELIQHFCHWHPLQRSQGASILMASCIICESLCLGPSYFCGECDFHVHKSCLDALSQKIDHHHLYCTLVLLTTSFYRCIACQRENNSGLTFRSIERGFKLCMECVLRPKNLLNNDGTFRSIHHWHQLTIAEELGKNDAKCLVCREKCSKLVYYCIQCGDYFHKACAELPLELHHPLHKRHPLTLTSSLLLPELCRSCSLCRGDLLLSNDPHHSGVYHYKCKEYSFQLDKKCATSFPSIQYQGHPHLLTVVENMEGHGDCHVCSASCKNNMAFRCAECNFTLHLTCGPLPCEIKHSSHVHPLILEDFYVEENYTDLFPCHVCEGRRDPKLPIYLCAKGCSMMCEIKCVISEVMPKLLGEHGEVKLRTTFPDVASKVIVKGEADTDTTYASKDEDSPGTHSATALDLILGEMKKPPIDGIIRKWKSEMLRSQGIKLEREDGDKNLFKFSKEAFKDFSSKLDCTRLTLEGAGIPKFISQHDGSAVEGEYILPQTLIPVYQELFGRSSTISATFDQCSESKSFKSVFVFMLCAVVHNARATKLVDVTNERVLQWLTLLKLVEQAGFDIGFIFHQVKVVWQAHFLIQSRALVDDTSKHLRGEIDQLSKEEKELERRLEETRKKKRETEEQLDHHYDYEKDGIKSFKKEYKDVLLIKWKPASSVLIQSLPQEPDASN